MIIVCYVSSIELGGVYSVIKGDKSKQSIVRLSFKQSELYNAQIHLTDEEYRRISQHNQDIRLKERRAFETTSPYNDTTSPYDTYDY